MSPYSAASRPAAGGGASQPASWAGVTGQAGQPRLEVLMARDLGAVKSQPGGWVSVSTFIGNFVGAHPEIKKEVVKKRRKKSVESWSPLT